jgi:hypothetical protein
MKSIRRGELIRTVFIQSQKRANKFAPTLLVVLLLANPAHAALGRLFFTSAQRVQMDAGVKQSVAQPTKITGMVQQDGGVRTLWVNGVATRANKTSPVPVQQPTRPIVIRKHE